MKFSILFFVPFFSLFAHLPNDDLHLFAGKHFLASYEGCDLEAIGDLEKMVQALDEAVFSSGATILDSCSYVFQPNGLTRVYLLSESHASIHTYPEYGACFVDLFTCGDNCNSEKFDQILREYLKPTHVDARLLLRHSKIEELK